jgi:hypothetical protein
MPSISTQGGFDLTTGKLTVNSTEKKDVQGKVSVNANKTARIEFILLLVKTLQEKLLSLWPLMVIPTPDNPAKSEFKKFNSWKSI